MYEIERTNDLDGSISNIIRRLSVIEGFQHFIEYQEKNKDVEFYIAGGAVRNYFMNSSYRIKDVDLFYLGNIDDLILILKSSGNIVIGPFGSYRWYPKNDSTLHYDIISIKDFDNGVEKCENIVDVLKQFDFTANSLAFSLKSKDFYNPISGLTDLGNKILRLVRFDFPDDLISPSTKIARTSVLWFRLLHYANTLNFNIENETMKWIIKNNRFYEDIKIFKEYFFEPKINKQLLENIILNNGTRIN